VCKGFSVAKGGTVEIALMFHALLVTAESIAHNAATPAKQVTSSQNLFTVV
jgi:hypothetical protein